MKKASILRLNFLLISLLLILGCANPENPTDNPTSSVSTDSAKIIMSYSDLPIASSSNKGQLYYVIDIAKFYYSNGTTWVLIDLTGPTGPAGPTGPTGPTGPAGPGGTDGSSATIYTTDTTIDISQSPLSIIGDFIVAPGVTLKIEKGVSVVFYPNSGLYIEGNLIVNGTNSSKVTFEAYFSGFSSLGTISFGKQSNSNITYSQFNLVPLLYAANPDKSHKISYSKFIDDGIRSYVPITIGYSNACPLDISNSTFLNTSSSSIAITSATDLKLSGSIINGYSIGVYASSITGSCAIKNSAFSNCTNTSIIIISGSYPINVSGNNYDLTPQRFLNNYSSQPINMTNSYFGGLSGSAVNAKISSIGSVDISGILTAPHTITGCGW